MHLALSAVDSHSTSWLKNPKGNQTTALGTLSNAIFHTFLHKKKLIMQGMNACINLKDKITETPDENGLLTLEMTIFTSLTV